MHRPGGSIGPGVSPPALSAPVPCDAAAPTASFAPSSGHGGSIPGWWKRGQSTEIALAPEPERLGSEKPNRRARGQPGGGSRR